MVSAVIVQSVLALVLNLMFKAWLPIHGSWHLTIPNREVDDRPSRMTRLIQTDSRANKSFVSSNVFLALESGNYFSASNVPKALGLKRQRALLPDSYFAINLRRSLHLGFT